MDLKELLDARSILLVDEHYGGLKDTTFSKYLIRQMLHSSLDAVAAFICDGRMRGLAFQRDFWTLVTEIVYLDSEFESCAATLFQETPCEERRSYAVDAADFNRSIMALLSDSLVSGDSCE